MEADLRLARQLAQQIRVDGLGLLNLIFDQWRTPSTTLAGRLSTGLPDVAQPYLSSVRTLLLIFIDATFGCGTDDNYRKQIEERVQFVLHEKVLCCFSQTCYRSSPLGALW